LAGVYKESIDYCARRCSPPDITDGAAATLKAAKAEFRKSWGAWKAWAKLEEVA
jgi:hypothetical protein